jgi:hypothetical protein
LTEFKDFPVEPGKNRDVPNEQINIEAGGLYSFPHPLPKREGGYIHRCLPGAMGTESPSYLTDGMEDETEEINGMGSGDSIDVCNFNKELQDYIDFVLGGVSNR